MERERRNPFQPEMNEGDKVVDVRELRLTAVRSFFNLSTTRGLLHVGWCILVPLWLMLFTLPTIILVLVATWSTDDNWTGTAGLFIVLTLVGFFLLFMFIGWSSEYDKENSSRYRNEMAMIRQYMEIAELQAELREVKNRNSLGEG